MKDEGSSSPITFLDLALILYVPYPHLSVKRVHTHFTKIDLYLIFKNIEKNKKSAMGREVDGLMMQNHYSINFLL